MITPRHHTAPNHFFYRPAHNIDLSPWTATSCLNTSYTALRPQVSTYPDYIPLRRVKPLPKRKRSSPDPGGSHPLNAMLPPILPPPPGPDATAEELIAHAEVLSAQITFQSYFLPAALSGVTDFACNNVEAPLPSEGVPAARRPWRFTNRSSQRGHRRQWRPPPGPNAAAGQRQKTQSACASLRLADGAGLVRRAFRRGGATGREGAAWFRVPYRDGSDGNGGRSSCRGRAERCRGRRTSWQDAARHDGGSAAEGDAQAPETTAGRCTECTYARRLARAGPGVVG
jgi:hypothetical protein